MALTRADSGLNTPSTSLNDVLVPVNGSPVSLDALSLACSISRRGKGTVYAVSVIEVGRALALDAEMGQEARDAEGILQAAEQLASDMDCKVEGEILQARDAGHAIVDEAIERRVDAIVMGAAYEMPFGEFALGRTARYVIDHAPCRVILVRAAVQD
jgi:nucleotide-binding universal stress UspA family protein